MSALITQVLFKPSKVVRRINSFRGAIISTVGNHISLFHNHDGDALVYAYPLIQYKKTDGLLSIVGINEGAEIIDDLWKVGMNFELTIDGEPVTLEVYSKQSYSFEAQISDRPMQTYILTNWLPFNKENYLRYKDTDLLADRISMLERLLIGNILSLLKGLDHWVEEQILVNISEIIKSSTLKYKGIELVSFDVKFKTNITLPLQCGIGKGSSKGFGVITNPHLARTTTF